MASYAALANALGRSESAVRKRLARLTEQHVLQGFIATPKPAVLGKRAIAAAWNVKIDVDDLLQVPGTVWAADSVDQEAGGLAFVDDDGSTWLESVTELAVAAPFYTTQAPMAPYDGPPLGPLELRVLMAIVRHPRGSATQLAKASGLSPKVARTRRTTLMEHEAVHVEPIIRGGHSKGIGYHAYVQAPKRSHDAVIQALEEAVVVTRFDDGLYVFCRAPDLHTKAKRIANVRALGVPHVQTVHHEAFRYAEERILAMIESQLALWKRNAGV